MTTANVILRRKVDPRLDPLRDDPRFQEWLRAKPMFDRLRSDPRFIDLLWRTALQ
ncbi:MAG TPA: hypothetical protein VNO70_09955 [Blastocatellia bacterium]|nr:hypothetical protein [Blastocatellia bacterium]